MHKKKLFRHLFFFIFILILFFSFPSIDLIKSKLKNYYNFFYNTFLEYNYINNFQTDINFFDLSISRLSSFDKIKSQKSNIQYQGNFRSKFAGTFFLENNLYLIINNGYVLKLNENDDIFNFIRELDLNILDRSFSGGVISANIFKHNNKNYLLSYSLQNLDDSKFLFLSLFQLDDLKKINEFQISFEDTHVAELGGGLFFDSDFLYLNVGIAGTATFNEQASKAQDVDSIFGKIIKVKLDELFINQKKLKYEIFSLGHKHLQGLVKTPSGIYGVEHSINGGDELNKIFERGNYGYPNYGYSRADKRSNRIHMNIKDNNYLDPIFFFSPSIAPTDISECNLKSKFDYAINPCLSISSLKGESIFLIKLKSINENIVIGYERINTKKRIRKLLWHNLPNKLYFFTDDLDIYVLNFKEKS